MSIIRKKKKYFLALLDCITNIRTKRTKFKNAQIVTELSNLYEERFRLKLEHANKEISHHITVETRAKQIRSIQKDIESLFKGESYNSGDQQNELKELFSKSESNETTPPDWVLNMKPINGIKVEPIVSYLISPTKIFEQQVKVYAEIEADLNLWCLLEDMKEANFSKHVESFKEEVQRDLEYQTLHFEYTFDSAIDKELSINQEISETISQLSESEYYNRLLTGKHSFIDQNCNLNFKDEHSKRDFLNTYDAIDVFEFKNVVFRLKYLRYLKEKQKQDPIQELPIETKIKDNQLTLKSPPKPIEGVTKMDLNSDQLALLFQLLRNTKCFNPEVSKIDLAIIIQALTGYEHNQFRKKLLKRIDVNDDLIKEEILKKVRTKLQQIIRQLDDL